MNLKKLLKEKQLPVKVRLQYWDKDDYFEVINFNDLGAIGYTKSKYPYSLNFCNLYEWELYQEPKKKIVLSEYLVKFSYAAGELYTPYFFVSDEEFKNYCQNNPIIKTGRTIEVELP